MPLFTQVYHAFTKNSIGFSGNMRNITWLTGGENCVTIIQMRQADRVVRGKCRMLTGEAAGVLASVGWRNLKNTFSGDGFVPWIT